MMGVDDILISGAVVAGFTAVGYVLGKRAKLRELHKLQDEGFLTITYLGHPRDGVKGKDVGPTMHELLHPEEFEHEDAPLQRVRYERRDQDGPRRDDWAKALKARSIREQQERPSLGHTGPNADDD